MICKVICAKTCSIDFFFLKKICLGLLVAELKKTTLHIKPRHNKRAKPNKKCFVLKTVLNCSPFGQLSLNNLKKGPALNFKLKFIRRFHFSAV